MICKRLVEVMITIGIFFLVVLFRGLTSDLCTFTAPVVVTSSVASDWSSKRILASDWTCIVTAALHAVPTPSVASDWSG